MKRPASTPVSRERLAGVLALFAGLAVAQAESLVVRPSADTSLFEQYPENNLGHSRLAAGSLGTGSRSRALIRFDLTAIPTNATVQSAILAVVLVRSPPTAVASEFELRRVLKSWVEGDKGQPGVDSGAPGTIGEPTWNLRAVPDQGWGAPGGRLGVDFADAVSATTRIVREGDYQFGPADGFTADVQRWIKTPAENWGWVLRSQDEATKSTARRFGGREEAGSEPVLTVTYVVPGPDLRIDSFVRVGHEVKLQFAAEAGWAYAVERVSTLGDTNWMVISTLASKFSPTKFTVTDPIVAEGVRFYRLHLIGQID